MLIATDLLEQAAGFRRDAAASLPGRLAALIERRAAQLLQLTDAEPGMPDDLTDAEQVAVDLAEQFIVDAHGISDARFGELGLHFSPSEQVAILFHLALVDGFAKLAKAHPDSAEILEVSS